MNLGVSHWMSVLIIVILKQSALIKTHNRANVLLYNRMVKFINSLINCQSNVVHICIKLALHGSVSNTCNNINVLCKHYNFNKNHLLQDGTQMKCNNTVYDNKHKKETNTIIELIEIREKTKYVRIMNNYECLEMLKEICTAR